MLLKKRSIFSGHEAEMEIPCTPEDILRWQRSGRPIQEVLPHLTPDQREFLLSGALPEEWDDLMGDE